MPVQNLVLAENWSSMMPVKVVWLDDVSWKNGPGLKILVRLSTIECVEHRSLLCESTNLSNEDLGVHAHVRRSFITAIFLYYLLTFSF